MPPKPSTPPASVIGVVLIIAGILVFIGQSFDLNLGRFAWPLFIIVPGLLMLAVSLYSDFGNKVLTVLGTTTAATGLLLAYQNTFNHFESWAYAWALVTPFATGLGLSFEGRKNEGPALISIGRKMMGTGGAIFVIGAVFFELIINISGRGIPNFFSFSLPGVLIVAGVIALLWRYLPVSGDDAE